MTLALLNHAVIDSLLRSMVIVKLERIANESSMVVGRELVCVNFGAIKYRLNHIANFKVR